MGDRSGPLGWRLAAVVAVLAISASALVLRLAYVQLARHDDYLAQAQGERIGRQEVAARRGAILDANGYPLAMSLDTFDVYLYRPAWSEAAMAREAATALAPLLGKGADELLALRNQEGAAEFPVARQVDYDLGKRIGELRLPGVRLEPVGRRIYPEGGLAGPLIGFLGFEGKGLTGLERDQDALLNGRAGQVVYERDALGNPISRQRGVPPRPGSDLVLTLDRYIQRLAEQELDAAVKKHRAAGGDVIVMDVRTGAILAMASRPSFDLISPNLRDPSQAPLFRNRVVTDLYEPGSVFKIITVAAALNEALVSPGSTYNDTGVAKIGIWSIFNWDYSANGTQTVVQLLQKSLNTGAVWLSELLGPRRFYDYVTRFGFGQPTGIGLDGEAAGYLRTPADNGWAEVDMATNSFGQGLSVTPLQVVAAVAAIANDGLLMRPYVVKEVAGPEGKRLFRPQAVRQVISPQTSQTMRQVMNAAVTHVPAAHVPGYEVAGKTGTASIAKGNGYDPDRFIASFAGFAPLSRPRIAILVKIDEPRDVPWGSTVAAPVFGHLAERILDYLRVPLEEPLLVQEAR